MLGTPVDTRISPRPPRKRSFLGPLALALVVIALVVAGAYYSLRTRSVPAGAIDEPSEGALLTDRTAVSGWAIDQNARGNTGVDGVQIFVDGAYVGDAYYGIGRPDLGRAFGLQFSASGWSMWLEPGQLSSGPHTLEAHAHSSLNGQVTTYPRTIVVAAGSEPFGAVDVPDDGATVSSLTEVRGWALDARAHDGTGIDRVQVFLDGALIADAQYGLARPDVAGVYGAQFADAGWSTRLDPAGLSLGQHTLEARARSLLSGEETTYSHTLFVQQATYPRGAWDIPADGETVSGSVTLQGWALDEASVDGSGVDRVEIFLDNQPIGVADYGQSRPEIGAAYGQRFTQAGWRIEVDLTNQPPGQHTLEARARSALTHVDTSYARSIVIGQ